MKKLLSKFSILPLLMLLLVWTTIGVLPIFDQSLVAAKFIFVLLSTLLMGIIYLSKNFKRSYCSFIKTPFTLSIGFFGLITLVSILFNNRYPVESLLGLGGIFLGFSLIIFFGSNLLQNKTDNNNKLMAVVASLSGVLALTTILQYFNYGPSILLNKWLGITLPTDILFNLSGSVLVALQFTLVVAVGFAFKVITTKKAKLWENITLIISAITSLFYGWLLLPGKATTPIILSPTASWSVAISTMKNLKNVLIGVGPSNYIKAFNLYKPNWMNNTPLWNIQFSQGANFPLTLIVTLGLFGLITWLIFALVIIKQTKKINPVTKPIHSMLITTILLQLFLPVNVVMLVFQAVLVIFWVASERERFHLNKLTLENILSKVNFLKNKTKYVSRALIGLSIVICAGLIYLTIQASYSSFLMFKASKSALNNDLVKTYNFQHQAIKLNPLLDTNRRKYAITNLLIASVIPQKADLTNDDKERFATLIQETIREGKAAIYLDQNDLNNWQNLAQIYQTLSGVAENSEEWAVKSYSDAIRLSPNNPQLRVALGGVLFNAKEYEEALKLFSQAATLKPDYANAYYNAANTFKMLRKFDQAKAAYQKTLVLLQADSEDYLKAADELQTLEELAKGEIEKQAEEKSEENNTPVENIEPVEDTKQNVEAPPVTTSDDAKSLNNVEQ